MNPEEYAALGALMVLFVGVLWLTRRSSRRRKQSRHVTPKPAFYVGFEQQAIVIATRISESALARLTRQQASLVPGTQELRDLREMVRALSDKLRELREGTIDDDDRHHEWDYLAAAASERYPVLASSIADLNQPFFDRAAAGEEELVLAVRPVLSEAKEQIDRVCELLRTDPPLVWTQLDLVVLTILMMDLSEHDQASASRHLDLRPKSASTAKQLQQGLSLAIDLLHATPREDRVSHDELLVPRLDDPNLGSALVRHRINRAKNRDDLTRARALLLGEPELLWLALSVVEKASYPVPASALYGRLAALVRKLLREGGDVTDTEVRLVTAAREVFDAGQSAALLETVKQMRAGRAPEELFARVTLGTPV